MGIISVNGLRLTGHIGVSEQERRVGNEFEINISLDVPEADHASATDNIDDTINYAEVIDIARRQVARPTRLIETVAGNIRNAIIERYGSRISSGSLTVAKLAPPVPAQLVSVSYTISW